MAPTCTSFVVLGSSGSLSPYIIDALSKEPDVKKARRPFSLRLSYINESRVPASRLISTLPNAAVTDTQRKIALAAKETGTVKLFFPSEFGVVTYGLGGKGQGWLSEKDEINDFLKSIDLPYARVFTGIWTRFIPWLTGYDANGNINIPKDKGDTPISFTAEEDTSDSIAYVSTHLPPSQLANARFRLEGERLTTKEIASRLGKPIEYMNAIPGEWSELRCGWSRGSRQWK